MAKTKKRAAPRVSVSYANCTVISSVPVTCPLCGVVTTPGTVHHCTRPSGEEKG